MAYQVGSSLQQNIRHISVSVLTRVRQRCVARCRGGMNVCP